MDKYRDKIAIFNDDVQGTGIVTLAALQAALKVSDVKMKDCRVLCFGAGTAGTGIADMIVRAIGVDSEKDDKEAAKQIWYVTSSPISSLIRLTICIRLMDKPGLLLKSMGHDLTHGQHPYARDDEEWKGESTDDLTAVIKKVKPHVIIGTSTKPGAFTKEAVQEMAKHVDRPIVFPLSNPTKLHEAQPEDINSWTKGKALIATGSPFPPVEHDGVKYEVAECNNSTAFPGVGLGGVLCRTRLVSDKMLVAATKALAAQAPALKDPNAGLLPDVEDVRDISVQVAKAVIKTAVEEGLNQEKDIPTDDKELEEWIREQMWEPRYRELKKVEKEDADKAARGEAGIQGGHE